MKLEEIEQIIPLLGKLYITDTVADTYKCVDLQIAVIKLLAIARAASLAPIREQWNEDRCDGKEYKEFLEAGEALEKALMNLEDGK